MPSLIPLVLASGGVGRENSGQGDVGGQPGFPGARVWVALPLSAPICGPNGGKIDKAFRIATPMRKASWTKRFAAGWGERRRASGDGGSGEGG